MDLSRRATQVVNGKVVYLVRLTDTQTTKLNILTEDLKTIDETFSSWHQQLADFAKKSNCHSTLLLEFLSKYSAEVNRAFSSLLRLMEIQDIFEQVSKLNQEVLVGYSNLPKFITSQLSIQLDHDKSMALTVKALEEGLSVLARPLIDVEHKGQTLELNMLFAAPQISTMDSFCTIEYLRPLKFNISNTCYTGPVTQTNLAQINCKNSQKIITVEALKKCYQNDVTVLCPTNILKMVSNIPWLGFKWNPDLKISVPRHHLLARDCEELHPLIFLGGRYFLSATSGNLTLNTGTLKISPLTVYNFPCNVSFDGMKTGLTTCLEKLGITLPIFYTDQIKCIPWQTVTDPNLLELHQKSLKIPPQTKINKTIVTSLDQLYQHLDLQLANTINEANERINNIQEVSTTTLNDILLYIALSLSILNSVTIIICACCFNLRQKQTNPCPTPTDQEPLQDQQPLSTHSRKRKNKCHKCDLPLKKPNPELIPLQVLQSTA